MRVAAAKLVNLGPDYPAEERGLGTGRGFRLLLFAGVFMLVAGGGLLYDYSRAPTYRATSRLSVEPPAPADDATRANFAVAEAQAMRRSEYLQAVAERLKSATGASLDAETLERMLRAEPVPQMTTIELHAEGADRPSLVAALGAWFEVYAASRKQTDIEDESEAIEEARHTARVAQQNVEDKRKDMEAFRRRHGISSVERDENPGAARLKGLHTALNDAATKEVNADAKVRALSEAASQGKEIIRPADKVAIANLETRALDMREKVRDLEHDFTAQYLAMDPKYKALKANLSRVEQQIEREKERSLKAAINDAQEEHNSAQRAAQRIREQAESLKQETQAFSTRFVELKRMGYELEQLQEARRLAAEKLNKLESARKPAVVKVRLLTAPSAAPEPIAPNYTRDAFIAVTAGILLAIAAVWVADFLRRDPNSRAEPAPQPVIQIAYPVIGQERVANGMLPAASAPALIAPEAAEAAIELTPSDIAVLWSHAPAHIRLALAAFCNGIGPGELANLSWRDVDLANRTVQVPGRLAPGVKLNGPFAHELASFGARAPEDAVALDSAGNRFTEAALDAELAYIAHEAGLRHPEEITGRAIHFTYAAYLARQGMKLSELTALVGNLHGQARAELLHLSPIGQAKPSSEIVYEYPGLPIL